jgi:hypothetical protein
LISSDWSAEILLIEDRSTRTWPMMDFEFQMNDWRTMGGGQGALNVRDCVQTPANRQAKILGLKPSRDHGRKGTIVIAEHLASDAYGLLILAPEVALGSGWLGMTGSSVGQPSVTC